MRRGDTEWTDDLVGRLTKVWDEGMTTIAIGRELGASKSAIVAKAHRLGLVGRPSPISPNRPSKPVKPKTAGRITLPPLASLE